MHLLAIFWGAIVFLILVFLVAWFCSAALQERVDDWLVAGRRWLSMVPADEEHRSDELEILRPSDTPGRPTRRQTRVAARQNAEQLERFLAEQLPALRLAKPDSAGCVPLHGPAAAVCV